MSNGHQHHDHQYVYVALFVVGITMNIPGLMWAGIILWLLD